MKKWLILFTICLDWSLMWVDFTAVNVALAPIANDFHTSLGTLQWVITAYTLCSASLMAIGGRLGDMYGHKRLFIIGTLIFVISSATAGFAPDATSLILSRIGQGIGIALVVPITTALVYLIFDQKQKGLALGFLTGTTGVAMAIGPTVGGLLITYLNWRWVFFINIPIGLIAIFMALILISETKEKKKVSIDFPGIFILAGGLLSVLLALNKVSEWGLLSLKFWGLVVAAFLLLGFFVRIEEKARDPLIHLDLLKNKTLMGIISLRSCAQYVFFVFIFVISLYLQNILGFSADKAGYLLLAATIMLAILSPLAGHLINYFSMKFLIASSCFVLFLSLMSLIVSSLNHEMMFLILSLILFGIAFAIHFPTTNMAALQTSKTNQSALVTGMLFTMAFASASAGITFSSTLLNDLSKNKTLQLLTQSKIIFNSTQQTLVQAVASGSQSINKLYQLLPPAFAPSFLQRSFIYFSSRIFIWIYLGNRNLCIVSIGSNVYCYICNKKS